MSAARVVWQDSPRSRHEDHVSLKKCLYRSTTMYSIHGALYVTVSRVEWVDKSTERELVDSEMADDSSAILDSESCERKLDHPFFYLSRLPVGPGPHHCAVVYCSLHEV